MLDRRRDVNIVQGIVVAVVGVLATGWDWLMYRNVADALRAGLRGVVVALFTTGLFIMVTGMLAKRRERRGPVGGGSGSRAPGRNLARDASKGREPEATGSRAPK